MRCRPLLPSCAPAPHARATGTASLRWGKCQCTGSYTSTREEIFRAPNVIPACILTAVSALTRYSVVPSYCSLVTCIHSLNLRKTRIPRDMCIYMQPIAATVPPSGKFVTEHRPSKGPQHGESSSISADFIQTLNSEIPKK